MLEILQIINIIIVITAGAFALLVTFSKPLRKKLFENKQAKQFGEEELKDRRETDKCLLRDRILSSYFKHCEDCKIKQYEFENVTKLYSQYIKLGGNSFVCEIYAKMQNWRIIS